MSEIKEMLAVPQETTVGYRCDGCGKERREVQPPPPDAPYAERRVRQKDHEAAEQASRHWHRFLSGHHDWGNDSGDSIDWWDVCSPACYVKVLRGLVSQLADSSTSEIEDMPVPFVVDLLAYIDRGAQAGEAS